MTRCVDSMLNVHVGPATGYRLPAALVHRLRGGTRGVDEQGSQQGTAVHGGVNT